MTTITLQRNIDLTTHRCYDCRRWFANETGQSAQCPMCASDTNTKRREELQAQKRTIAALRGALKRKSRRRA